MRKLHGLGVAVCLTGLCSAASAQPKPADAVAGGALRPWLSPPGWFGPGPGWHNRSDPGPGNGWQYYGLPDGPTVGYPPSYRAYSGFGPGYWGPGWWGGPPGAAGSFYTNGRSLYGPPVPTYGPTPGVFGATDDNKRFFRNPPPANGIWIGLGFGGTRSPSPRFVPQTVSVYPPTPMSVEVVTVAPVTTPEGNLCLKLLVRVPEAGADLWVDKTELKTKGIERTFESPALKVDQTYQYVLVARWTENGADRTESRTVRGAAGQTISVDFTKPAG